MEKEKEKEKETEIRNNNGVTEIKTDKFIYKHKHSFSRSGETVFDLYTDFEKIKKHIIKYNFFSSGNPIINYEKYKKDIENTTLHADEYFIGVDMNMITTLSSAGKYQPVYTQVRWGSSISYVYIFYTNYGNIIEIGVDEEIGGGEPLYKYIVIKNDHKLNLEQINFLNTILTCSESFRREETLKCVYLTSSFINNILNTVIYKYVGIPRRPEVPRITEEIKKTEEPRSEVPEDGKKKKSRKKKSRKKKSGKKKSLKKNK